VTVGSAVGRGGRARLGDIVAATRASRRDLLAAAGVLAWIGSILLVDGVRSLDQIEPARQVAFAAATWLVFAALLRPETPLVRAQTLVVVALATCVEYTFSPLLEAYVYRIGTVPLFVPPGHGLVYLAALTLGRTPLFAVARRPLVLLTVAGGGVWAASGLLQARHDVLGAFWFACLLAFLAWGPNRLLYVGAFVVVSYLELAGTALGTWAWAPTDPVLHLIGQGNPPSGAAGGYGWFDLYALLLAPAILRVIGSVIDTVRVRGATRQADDDRAASTSSCSKALVASALPPRGPSPPSTEVKRPPASTTTGTSAAMS
jgi:hypothetical protein